MRDHTLPTCSHQSIVIPDLSWQGPFSTDTFEIDNHVYLIIIANSSCPHHLRCGWANPPFSPCSFRSTSASKALSWCMVGHKREILPFRHKDSTMFLSSQTDILYKALIIPTTFWLQIQSQLCKKNFLFTLR